MWGLLLWNELFRGVAKLVLSGKDCDQAIWVTLHMLVVSSWRQLLRLSSATRLTDNIGGDVGFNDILLSNRLHYLLGNRFVINTIGAVKLSEPLFFIQEFVQVELVVHFELRRKVVKITLKFLFHTASDLSSSFSISHASSPFLHNGHSLLFELILFDLLSLYLSSDV